MRQSQTALNGLQVVPLKASSIIMYASPWQRLPILPEQQFAHQQGPDSNADKVYNTVNSIEINPAPTAFSLHTCCSGPILVRLQQSSLLLRLNLSRLLYSDADGMPVALHLLVGAFHVHTGGLTVALCQVGS